MSHPPARTYPITSITQVDSDKSNKPEELLKQERESPIKCEKIKLSQPNLKAIERQGEQSHKTLLAGEYHE